eukprot:scaffold247430_cov26-Tisochrysis_lutea.AAC.2
MSSGGRRRSFRPDNLRPQSRTMAASPRATLDEHEAALPRLLVRSPCLKVGRWHHTSTLATCSLGCGS